MADQSDLSEPTSQEFVSVDDFARQMAKAIASLFGGKPDEIYWRLRAEHDACGGMYVRHPAPDASAPAGLTGVNGRGKATR